MRRFSVLTLFSLLGLSAQPPELFTPAERATKAGDYRAAIQILNNLKCPPATQPACDARRLDLTGNANAYAGNYPAAFEAFEQSLSLWRKAGDAKQTINVLNNIGSVHFFQGDYAAARKQYLEAERLLNENKTADWHSSTYQFTQMNLATLYQRIGRYRQALDIYKQLGRRPEGLSAAEQTQLLSNLAVLNRKLGDPYKTRTLLEEALKLANTEQQLDAWLGIMKNLGIVMALDFEDLVAADANFSKVLAAATKHGDKREAMQAKLYLAETKYRRGRFDEAAQLWVETLKESRALATREDEWRSLFGLARTERATGKPTQADQHLTEAANLIRSLRTGIGAPSLRTEFLADKYEVFELQIEAAAQRNDTAAAYEAMEAARALSLKESLPRRTLAATLVDFQKRLQPGDGALLFSVGKTKTVALWATPSEAGLREIKLSFTELTRLVEQFNTHDVDLSIDLIRNLPPVSDAQTKRLWIVPDGPLAFLPFEVLPVNGAPLIERFETIYLPSAGFLRSEPELHGRWHWPWERQMLAYAEPPVESIQLLPGDERWSPLPQSGIEVKAISRILPGPAKLLRGAETSAPKLLADAARAPILHLATHGTGDAEQADRSRLLVGNGYLYAGQLTPGILPDLQLAVLSACDTETGAYSRGEGVQSLARRFLLAGARVTVASLWKVDDQATRLFMESFYRELANGASPAAALRETKRRVLHSKGQMNNPTYWAAFIAQGAAATPLPRWISWTEFLAGVAIVISIVAFAINFSIKRRVSGQGQRG